MKLDEDGFHDALLNSELSSIDRKPESAVECFDIYHWSTSSLQLRRPPSGASKLQPGWTMNVVNFVVSHAGWSAVTVKRCNQLISSCGWNRSASGTNHTVGRKTSFGIYGLLSSRANRGNHGSRLLTFSGVTSRGNRLRTASRHNN